MSVICPNLSNPDVAREFNELKAATNERAAYAIWSLNNGNGIDKAPNGAKSILFENLLLHYGDKTKAILAKAKLYGKSFRSWFGDWTSESQDNVSKITDINNEPFIVYHNSMSQFTEFRRDAIRTGNGFFFTTNPIPMTAYGLNQYPVFLNIKTLRETESEGFTQDDINFSDHDGTSYYYGSDEAFIVPNANQIKHIDNIGTYQQSNENMYDDYHSIIEINHYDNDIDSFVVDQIIKAKQENPDADILKVAQEAKRQWVETRQKVILNDTQMKLAEAYGLRQEVGEDGRIRFVSDSNDERTLLIIDFLDYISGDTEGYYDFNSKSVAAHHVIGISLANGDPSTFSHELAHHYVRMFWRSKLIQTALRAVDKPGMTDEEREEALVDIITAKTNDSQFFSSIESESFIQKFWGALANLLYNTFGIENKAIRNALYRNITKAFILNEKQRITEKQNNVFAMANQRMFKKAKSYREKLKTAREEFRRNKSVVAYEQVGNDKTQKAIKSIIQGSISRNKNFRKNNIDNAKILVDMLIAEDRVRAFAGEIQQYRQNYLTSIGVSGKPTSRQRKNSVLTTEELNANINLIRGFIEQARNELTDVAAKFVSMESARWGYYVTKEVVNPVTGETVIEYLDSSHINDPDVNVVEVDFNELNDISQNILGFYDITIKNLYNAVRSVEFKNTYGEDIQAELLAELTSVNTIATAGPRMMDTISDLKACFDDAITERLRQFVARYINENAKELTDEQREKLIYSTNTWLENQNAFGDIGVTEVWMGLASNSKSSLIRIMQDLIDNMKLDLNDAVNEKGFYLRELRIKAMKAATVSGIGVYGALSPYNIDKLFMERDEDGFTGNFITAVNEGKYYHDRSKFIDGLLYNKGGIQDRLRSRLGDNEYELQIDSNGEPMFPEGQDDIEKDYLHEINHWMGKHAVRRFTVAYYDMRIDMLSSVTRKAQTLILNQINDIIRACTINGKVHTELLSRTKMMDLQRLYYRKSQLSNPFDQYGRKKPDGSDEALIAKELTAWNKWQAEHVKNKLDYDAFNEARDKAKDKDQFDRDNTYTAINPEIWEEIARLFPKTSLSTIEDLRYTRNKLLSIVKTKRGLYYPRIEQVLDLETGEIRPEYQEFWDNLKRFDELIETLKYLNKTKWTKQQLALYQSLMSSSPVMIDLKNGTSEDIFVHIKKAIIKRLEDKYGKGSPMVNKELPIELDKFQYTVRINGQSAKKGKLSIFKITLPPAKQVSTSKGLIDSTVKQPILAYSIIDAENSDPMYVDKRFKDNIDKPTQPITDDTKNSSDQVSYTNEKYKRYIENGPQELKDYYNALVQTMKETYENIPFLGAYDGRLPQLGANTGQMFHRDKWWNIGKPIAYWARRNYSINESDADINVDYELRPDGTRSMNIPVRYVKRLDNSNEINSDILGSVISFYEMGINYKNKSKALPLFLTAVEKLENTSGYRTRLKTFLKGIVNRSFYERSRNFDVSEDNLASYVNVWVRRALKWIPGLRLLTTTGLLALNWLAAIVAYLDPAVLLAVDGMSGKYIDLDDYIQGTLKMLGRLPAAIMSAGKSKSYDKVSSGMVKFGLAQSGAANFRHMDRSQIRRFLQSGLTMLPFSLGEHTVNAQVFCTTLLSYKYIWDEDTQKGMYMNKREFFEYAQSKGIPIREAKLKFKTQTHTLFDAYNTDEKGNFVPTNTKYGDAITPELEERIGKRMRNRASVTNLIVPGNERTKIQSNIITAFVVVMRTFMLVGISERFRSLRDFLIDDDSPIDENKQSETKKELKKEYAGSKGGYNFQTGEIEDGIMAGLGHALRHPVRNLKYMWYSFKHPMRSRYNDETKDFILDNDISETDIYAINRFVNELLACAFLIFAQIIFHNKMVDDGDDDKYWYQVIDHILIRLSIVRYTWYDFNTFMDLVNSITPSKTDIDKKLKLADLIVDAYQGFKEHGTQYEDWEKVKSGGYKNAPKAFRDLLQVFSSLGLHNLYTAKSTEGVKTKTKWFKSLVWWKGFWHDAAPGTKPSKSKRSYKQKSDMDMLNDLNSFGGQNDLKLLSNDLSQLGGL